MTTILFLFVLLVYPVYYISSLLTKIMQSFPGLAKKVELTGYFLLVASLSLGLVASDLTDMGNDSRDMILNEKIDMLWRLEGRTLRETNSGEIGDSYQYFLDNRDSWRFWTTSGDDLNEQVKFANITSYVIGAISAVLVAVAKISSKLTPTKNERKLVKGVYRNSRKRRGK